MTAVLSLITRLDALRSKRRPRPDSLSDAELVDLFLRKNDPDAFEVLVRRYRNKVFSLAISILGPSTGSEAEDATQEVFIVVYRALKTFRGDAAFSTWLYRVARNQVLGFRRRPAHRVVSGSDDGLIALVESDPLANPSIAFDKNDVRQQVLQVVDELTEPQRIIVRLFYWQEQSINSIAMLLEIEANTVKSHLRRARLTLAKKIKGSDVGY
jgi:RNA polymerase sigma-70 factor (ECF subfamily)